MPEVEQQQVRTGNLTEGAVTSHDEVEIPAKFDVPQIQDSSSTSLLIPSSANSSLVLHSDHASGLLSSSTVGTSTKIGIPFPTTGPELGNFGSPSYHYEGLITSNERAPNHRGKFGKILRGDNTLTPRSHRIRFINGSPLKGANRTSPTNSQENKLDKISPVVERNLLPGHSQSAHPVYSWKAAANPDTRSTPSYPKEFANVLPNISSWNIQTHKDDRSWNIVSTNDPMDVSRR